MPSAALPNTILPNGDFDSSTTGWNVYVTGGNLATVKRTTINPYDGAGCAKYECTYYTPSGYVCMQGLFAPTAGETYTVSFRYRSTVSFNAFVITISDAQTHYTYISCTPSSSWKLMSFVANLTWLELTWIDFRFHSTGTIYVDDVSVVLNSLPTPPPTEAPTPTPTTSPSPSVTPTPTPAGPSPTPTQSPAPTPTPTATPAPTPSPTTTSTPTPTSIITPTPTPSSGPTTNPAGFFPQKAFYAAAIIGVAVIAITMLIQKRQ